MSQHDFEIANQGFPSFRSDLNSGLQALASNSAGATEPSSTYAYQFWYDETTDLLKLRNSDNDAWITLAYFDQTNDEWEIRSAVIQAVDSAGVVIKTDDGTTRLTIADGGDVTVANGLNVTGDLNADSGTLFVDASNNRVGVGTTSPEGLIGLPATASNTPKFRLQSASTNTDFAISSYADANGTYVSLGANHYYNSSGNDAVFEATDRSAYVALDARNSGAVVFGTAASGTATERARITSDGYFLVGTTTTQPGIANTSTGISLTNNNIVVSSRASGATGIFNVNTDGEIMQFRKSGSTIGSINTLDNNSMFIGSFDTFDVGLRFINTTRDIRPCTSAGLNEDDQVDLGDASARFDDIFATNGTIQTSDRNEKQDIEELSEAEQRVAVAAKSLMRKFRWKSAVEKKGDDARIHFGIIAQDLQAAFEAEGLDAGRYAMLIYSEWWETYTDVPAVEAVDAVYETVTDEEGNETQVLVSEAIEAKEAYTRTDTYETEEEAPEGAVKKSRMGVRYSELLAFIIAAI